MSDDRAEFTGVTHNVSVTRIFDAPVEQVWKAWSESERVRRWWGPTGFTSPSAQMDFREGGTSLVCMRAPQEFGGQDFFNTWTYRTIRPYTLIEFDLHFADPEGRALDPAALGLLPGIPPRVRHVITFEVVGERRTRLTVTEHGYTSIQAHDLSRAGLEQCLDKLAQSL